MAKPTRHKILIIGTNMMNLYNHRLELIQRLLSMGYEVSVAAPEGGEEKKLEKLGCRFINMPVDNRGTNIKNDLKLLRDLKRIYKSENPDILLTFYTKTNIYGGIVARYSHIPYVSNICGLGSSLVKDNLLGNFMKKLYKQALKNASFVFFQNKSNIDFITGHKIYTGNYDLLPGSGVSLERYNLLPYPESNKFEFLFCSRVIKPKGIDQYIEAAYIIKKKYPDAIFHVAGPCDPIYEDVIRKRDQEGVIKYHGKIMDLKPVLERVHCAVLPSYYPEGMANILLESSASGRPVITTDLPGCGETVDDGVTGYVVKEKDSRDLAAKIEKFINLSLEEKRQMGLKAREKMEREFNRNIVVDKYVAKIQEISRKP